MNTSAGKSLEANDLGTSSGVLNDRQILRHLNLPLAHPDRLVITPIISLREQLNPFSFDLRLGTEFIVFERSNKTHLDPRQLPEDQNVFTYSKEEVRFIKRLSPTSEFVLHTNEFALGSTLEYLRLPYSLAGRLDGRSTWARVGLQVHSTAGLVHPGSNSVITFELLNVGMLPIKLYPGMRIGQINFYRLGEGMIRSYDRIPASKHTRHVKASRSAYWKDFIPPSKSGRNQ
jgi:dCTP deaminase